MFERYTESARRLLFAARYEASQLGASAIETEHLLLGLTRHAKGLTGRILEGSHLALEGIRREVESKAMLREKVSTHVEMPFSAETKCVLHFAVEEADRLWHDYVGTEHLLLGLLREEGSVAASILTGRGLRLNEVRQKLVDFLGETSDDVERIKRLVEQLGPAEGDEARELVLRIHRELDELKLRLEDR